MHIQSTFIHLNKIGKKSEKELWNKNILSWEEYQNYYEKNNPYINAEHLAWLYGELQEYDQDLFTTVSNLTKSTGRLELSQLKSIRNRYASSMNETQLQALASEHTEESKYRLDQYNYSIYVMDEIINQY